MAAVREAPAPPRPQAPPSKPQEETRQVCSSWGQGVLTTPRPCFASRPGGPAQTHLGPPRGPSPLRGPPPLPSTGSQARLLGDPLLGRAEGISPSSVSRHTPETREESPAVGDHAETLVGPRARPALSPSGRPGSTGLGHSLLSLGSMRPTPEGPTTSPGCRGRHRLPTPSTLARCSGLRGGGASPTPPAAPGRPPQGQSLGSPCSPARLPSPGPRWPSPHKPTALRP